MSTTTPGPAVEILRGADTYFQRLGGAVHSAVWVWSSSLRASGMAAPAPAASAPAVQPRKDPGDQVLAFLKQRGYTGAALVFEKERTITKEQQALQSIAVDQASQANSILLHREEQPQVYLEQYEKMREYVSKSLDMYKVELEQLLFPVFVHCFLEMIRKNHCEMAAQFFKRYNHDHVFLYQKEVEALQGLSSPQHLETSKLATMYLEHKFGLRMASHGFHVLRNFLHDNRLVLLLSIINEVLIVCAEHNERCLQHINIDVFAGDPEAAGMQDTMVVGLTGFVLHWLLLSLSVACPVFLKDLWSVVACCRNGIPCIRRNPRIQLHISHSV